MFELTPIELVNCTVPQTKHTTAAETHRLPRLTRRYKRALEQLTGVSIWDSMKAMSPISVQWLLSCLRNLSPPTVFYNTATEALQHTSGVVAWMNVCLISPHM